MNSLSAVRALVERGGVIWRERWESAGNQRALRIMLREPGGKDLVTAGFKNPFQPKATDLLATDWKWSPT